MGDTLRSLVVVGCSALGDDAVNYLMPRLNLDSSAYIIVSHIDYLGLSRSLRDFELPVVDVNRTTGLNQPGIYLIGDSYSIVGMEDNTIRLGETSTETRMIDDAMKNAALNYKTRCIGVILSGSGDDGTQGVRQIKNLGGKVVVQLEDEPSNGYCASPISYVDEMPKNSMLLTKVDFAGPLDKIVSKLNTYTAYA